MSGKYPTDAVYNKLVRDRIPEIIAADGLKVETKLLSSEEVINYLKQKSVEEAQELAEATEVEEIKKEMADLEEVLLSLRERLDISSAEIEEVRQVRAEKRGRFEKGIYLVRTYKEE